MGTVISNFLSPYEAALWAILALILLYSGIYAAHHLEMVGAQKQIVIEQKAAALQAKLVQETETAAGLQEKLNATKLAIQLATPPVNPIVVRMCDKVSSGEQLSQDAGQRGPGSPGVSRPVSSLPAGTDIGPFIEGLLSSADAEIAYWRARDAECVKVGLCRVNP